MSQFTKNNSALVALIGLDQPGIVATVASAFTRLGCNIEEMTQSILHGQFSSIFLVNKPEGLANEALEKEVGGALKAKRFRLTLVIRDFEALPEELPSSQPFVVSIWGRDANDIVATFSRIMSEQRVNIRDLRAKPLGTRALHRVMSERAKSMGLTLTMQHHRIFDAMHSVEL